MSEPEGSVCPECGAPRAVDGSPTCSCTRRAADAHRDTRTAEAAAAEDFDPLRIRPYVELAAGTVDASPAADAVADGDFDADTVVSDVPRPSNRQAPPPQPEEADPARRRRTRVAVAAGVSVVVLAVGGFVSGLFSYTSPTRDGAGPEGLRASVPDGASPHRTPSAEASRPTPGASSATPSGTLTSSADTTSPDHDTASPSSTPAETSPSGSATTSPGPSSSADPAPVLSYGDTGPEVTELQLRLRQVGLYGGDVNGEYDRQVQSAVGTYQATRFVVTDESGVYGHATRASLESETSQP